MKIITLLNEKGGVGKTTLAVHIAAGLAIRGNRVVIVDADPQAHATIGLGFAKEPCIHDLLVRKAPWQDSLRLVDPEYYLPPDMMPIDPNNPPKGTLLLVPSDVETRTISESISDALRLRKRLRELRESIDYIIIDTSPTPSLLHASIYIATDYILYPTKCEFFSFDGLAESLSHAEEANEARSELNVKNDLKTLGIIPTMVKPKTVAHQEGLAKLKEHFGSLVWPSMHSRTAWAEAAGANRMLFNFAAQDDKALVEMWSLVNRVQEATRNGQQ